MLSLITLIFIVAVCGTVMMLINRPSTKLTADQLRKEQWIVDEQSAIDAQASVYRVTLIRTSKNGNVSYKEHIVDEQVVFQLIHDKNK